MLSGVGYINLGHKGQGFRVLGFGVAGLSTAAHTVPGLHLLQSFCLYSMMSLAQGSLKMLMQLVPGFGATSGAGEGG